SEEMSMSIETNPSAQIPAGNARDAFGRGGEDRVSFKVNAST
ncbi:MAG: hypothetical protein H6R38_569, partial [Deltaproteobacteria bacterium]|nr:hypothetical protein [Deltaproteobacteria bacterium]